MKKSLVALAVLAASGAAMAQSSVTLYGRLDVGVGRATTETTGASPKASLSQTLVTSSALNTTYWGMRGTEDLGGGLKANFDLQQQFAVDSGAASNTLFERLATVGFSGGFGAVNLGRQYTAYDSLRGATNNVLDTNVATTGTVWKTGVTDYTNRASNSIRYDSPTMGGVSGAVVLGLGENKSATLDADQNLSAHVKYAAGPLLVGVAYQEEKIQNVVLAKTDAITGVITPGSAATATGTNKYTLFGASYDFGVAKLTGSYNKAKNATRDDKEYQLGVNVPVSASAALLFGYSKANSTGAGLNDLNGKGYTIAGYYALSKRTTLYAGYLSTEVESGTTISTAKGTTAAAGVRHTF